MLPQQRAHIRTVMEVAEGGLDAPNARVHDEIIRASWSRCVHQHRLDPTRMQEAVILPAPEVRDHQDRIEEFLHIARLGMESMYQQVAGLGYCVLLTDAHGVTVDFIGDLQLDSSLRRAGLYLGADWSEEHAGTCGVGTAIATGQSLTVHLADHFDATHIPLTCTTAPVFDPAGSLTAILDISALSSPHHKESQHLALQMVRMYASNIENATFLARHRGDWIVKLSGAPQFLDLNPEYLLAIDAAGRVIGHNRRAQLLLEGQWPAPIIGMSFDRLFDATAGDLVRFNAARSPDQRAVTLAGSGRVLFMLASPPPVRIAAGTASPAPDRKPPAALAALTGGDPVLARQIERASRFVNSPVSVLLTGETGTGKEHFAKALHQASERRRRPFVAVNCAAIPESLIESELFGYLPGSFSGAGAKGKRGLIQEADGGTLFLDEIGDMPRSLQPRLLRVLAEREVLPLGATRAVAVNIRVVAATHCDLETLVREGRFRDDLYYRLNGAHIRLPPLRERRDFAWLVQRMLEQAGEEAGIAPPRLSAHANELLHAHRWPGNLRELRNAIDYACALSRDGLIDAGDLPDSLSGIASGARDAGHTARSQAAQGAPYAEVVGATDDASLVATGGAIGVAAGGAAGDPADGAADGAAHLVQALRAARWNVSAVARQFGVSRVTLYRRMQRHGIESPNRTDHT